MIRHSFFNDVSKKLSKVILEIIQAQLKKGIVLNEIQIIHILFSIIFKSYTCYRHYRPRQYGIIVVIQNIFGPELSGLVVTELELSSLLFLLIRLG